LLHKKYHTSKLFNLTISTNFKL